MSDQDATSHRESVRPAANQRVSDGFERDGPNTHFALLYEDQAEQFATAIPFVRDGLERGERCLYIVDDNSEGDVVDAMREAGIDVEGARDDGLLTLHTTEDTYLDGGSFDAGDVVDFVTATVEAAIEEEGFDHVRITGEMTWILDDGPRVDGEELATYEAELNCSQHHESVTELCQYDREKLPSTVLRDVVRTHPQLVYDGQVCQNFFYVPPERFFEDAGEGAGFERQTAALDQQTALEFGHERVDDGEEETVTEASAIRRTADPSTVRRRALANAKLVLDTDHVGIYRYDEDGDGLVPCPTQLEGIAGERVAGDVREAFVTNDTCVRAEDEAGTVAVPLGRHGVFVARRPGRPFDGADVTFAETVAANVRAAFDRAARETVLSGAGRETGGRRDAGPDPGTLVDLLRDGVRGLVETSSREELDEAVCDRLAALEGVACAGIGETDATSERLAVRQAAGREESYFAERRVEVHDGRTAEPAGRAAATRSTQVVEDIGATDDGATPRPDWSRDALDHGFGSVVAVPLMHGHVPHGVLAVYADQPAAFGDRFRAVLEDIGRAVGFGYDALEQRAALVSGRVTELDLEIDAARDAFDGFVGQIGREVTVLGSVPQQCDAIRVFFTVGDADRDRVADATHGVEGASLVSERDGTVVYETVVESDDFLGTLLAHGAIPNVVEATGDGVRIVVRMAAATDVGAFVEMVEERYGETTFHSRRTVERGIGTRHDFRSRLEEDLTDRQWDALQTAVLSGYFEWPRDRSGEEVATRLDVSQPTFNRHLRDGLRKILTPLFDGACDE